MGEWRRYESRPQVIRARRVDTVEEARAEGASVHPDMKLPFYVVDVSELRTGFARIGVSAAAFERDYVAHDEPCQCLHPKREHQAGACWHRSFEGNCDCIGFDPVTPAS